MSSTAIERNPPPSPGAIHQALRHINERIDRLDPQRSRRRNDASDTFVRAAVSHLFSRIERRSPDEVFADRYIRAVTNPAKTTTPAWAQELTSAMLVSFLLGGQSPSLLPQLIQLAVAVQIGLGGSLRVPYRLPGVTGAWVEESEPIPVVATPLASFVVTARKCASISVFSNELERGSQIETVVERNLRADLAKIIDGSLTDDQPGSPKRPAGLRWNVTATAPGADLPTTMAALLAAILAAGATAPCFIVNPLEGLALAFASPAALAFPILTSTNCPPGTILAVDLDAFVGSIGAPRMEASSGATLVMDDAPLPISTPGNPNVLGGTVRSTFQTDSTAVKCVFPASWGVAPNRVAWATL